MPPREETPMDQEVFDKALADELAKGTDRRVAEGRAKRAAVTAYRAVHGEPEREATPAAERTHAATGDGGGDGRAAPAGAPAQVPAAAAVPAAPAAAAVATAVPV